MKLRHLLAALCIAALAALAIIPAITILRAPMPTLSVGTVAHVDTSCDVANLAVQPAPYGAGTWWVTDGPHAPTMTVAAPTAVAALQQARTSWADSYGEMECAK